MSIQIMTVVWELDLPDSEKLALLALADNANDEGYCWPSMATLARSAASRIAPFKGRFNRSKKRDI
ncbi:MAG: helix-turn-helix domain-containing protein [Sphingomonadales bacterium]|nr:helix-turn-helix domain-containing protein [Sphingomonadales bacterium]